MQSRQESCYDQTYRRRGMRWDVRGFLNARSELHTSPWLQQRADRLCTVPMGFSKAT